MTTVLGQASPRGVLGAWPGPSHALGQQPSFATMYPGVGMDTPPLPSASAPWYGEQPGIVAKMLMGARDTLMQANQAMPWGGNDPTAIGIDPQAGTMDPNVMIPFASNVAGMATTGSMAAPPVAGAAGMGIRAYHGSPHDFDRFSMEKIGTGEGAQAYGHGLYFAENEGVARSYRDALKRGDNNSIVHIGDRDFPSDMGNYYLRQEMEKAVPPDATAFVSGRETYDFYNKELGDAAYRGLKRAAPTDDPVQAMAAAMDAKIKALSPYEDELPSVMAMRNAALAYAKDNVRLSPNGRMYEVDINASPDEFLDWDKPLSEQPEGIRRALGWTPEAEAAYKKAQEGDTDALLAALEGDAGYSAGKMPVPQGAPPLSATGAEIMNGTSVFDNVAGPSMSEKMRAAGIKGIRYKDAGSRKLPSTPATDAAQEWLRDAGGNIDTALTAFDAYVNSSVPAHLRDSSLDDIRKAIAAGGVPEQQTHNYVVFDENTINILKKYGLAGLTAGGGAAALMGGGSDPASASAPTYTTGGRF